MTECIAALDVGTTMVKTCLFSRELVQLECASCEYPLRFSGKDRVEAEASVYLDAIRRGFREVLSRGDYRVTALGFTTQGETLTAVDENGIALMPFIVWLDSRADVQAEKLKKLLPEKEFYETTGLPAIDGALPLAKLVYIKEEMPEVFRKAYRFLLLEDYLIFRFTGNCMCEKALATSSGWFSLKTDSYWKKALDAAGIPEDKLPRLVEPGTKAGALQTEMAAMLGLPAGIPVVAGAMDQTSAALASGCNGEGVITETTGTALVMAACTNSPATERGHRLTVYRHALKGKFLCLGIGPAGGRSLTWLRDLMSGEESYEGLNRLAGSVLPGADGVLFMPFLSGIVDPDACPDASGCFFGLRLGTTQAHLVRSVMEGVGNLLRDFMELFSERACPVKCVYSLGGGARSRLWTKIKADMCGVPFITADTPEMASRGAALLAAWGTGIIKEGTIPPMKNTETFEPDPDHAKIYEKTRSRYLKLYQALLPVYEGESENE